jgi:UDP-2,4-diacetamido-2,4,6-trideoxy-beta-L-altropyranose hydrolase
MAALEFGLRADASLDIGTGHVMRCLTLADALRRRGAVCRFICREHPGHLIDQILERGFEVLVLPGASPSGALGVRSGIDYIGWLGTDQATDAAQTREVLIGRRLDWLVVDHYALDETWERMIRPATRKVLVIDDLANRRHECELLLDQNLGRATSDYAYLLPATGTILAGPRYALLRPEFAALRAQSLVRRSTERVQQLLVTLGGVDKDNLTLFVLKVLAGSVLPADCQIIAVMGGRAPGLQAVREFAASTPGRIELRVDEKNMAALMVASDVAIGAAGGTAWERCCLGLPTLLVLVAENQLAGALALQARGAALVANAGLPLEEGLRAQLPHLLDPRRLSQMQAACIAMVDGEGVRRVVEKLLHVDI